MTSCCPPSSGTPWNTPLPGNIIAVPPGSTVIATPSANGCGCPEEEASGQVSSPGASPSTSTGFAFPTVTAPFDAPAANATGQFFSTGASGWAVPGLTLWISAYNGYVSVTGVSGDLITYKNLTLPQGSTVNTGTQLIPAAPTNNSGSDPTAVQALDSILGNVGGVNALIGGTNGDILQRGTTQWKLVNAPMIHLINSQPIALTVKRDVVNSTSTSTATNGKWLAPVVSAITGTAPTGTMTFPLFPVLEAGRSIQALVKVQWKLGVLTLDSLRVKVAINGVVWQVVRYCQAIADSAAAANTAAFTSAVNNKGPEGSDILIIPIPSDNAPVNVIADVRKAGNTAAPLDANSHYVAEFHVLGYLY